MVPVGGVGGIWVGLTVVWCDDRKAVGTDCGVVGELVADSLVVVCSQRSRLGGDVSRSRNWLEKVADFGSSEVGIVVW